MQKNRSQVLNHGSETGDTDITGLLNKIIPN